MVLADCIATDPAAARPGGNCYNFSDAKSCHLHWMASGLHPLCDLKKLSKTDMRTIFILLLCFLSPVASAEWRQLAEREDGDISMVSYYEPASLVRAKKPKISIMVIFSTPAPKFSWRASKFLWEANCFSKQIRLLASVDFTQMGPDIVPTAQDPYTEWMPPDDGSGKIHVYNLLCRVP